MFYCALPLLACATMFAADSATPTTTAGSTAVTAAGTPANNAAAVVAPRAKDAPPTIAEQFTAAAGDAPPTTLMTNAIYPGMTIAEMAPFLGTPSRVYERGAETELWWTSNKQQPIFIVWMLNGKAARLRWKDRL